MLTQKTDLIFDILIDGIKLLSFFSIIAWFFTRGRFGIGDIGFLQRLIDEGAKDGEFCSIFWGLS